MKRWKYSTSIFFIVRRGELWTSTGRYCLRGITRQVVLDVAREAAAGTPVETIAGKAVETVEGMGAAEAPGPIQAAFLAEQAGQCGYCLSGILIATKALLAANPKPDRAEIAAALDVTADYLIDTTASVQVEDATDNAFFRKYRNMDPATKEKIRRMAEVIGDDE